MCDVFDGDVELGSYCFVEVDGYVGIVSFGFG